jgi:two-component system chemotaxis sensor kinase CheA
MAVRRKRSGARSKAHSEFVSESEEILEQMREDLSQLADQRASRSDVAPELVNRLFRSAHSLKGLSGMFGFDAMSELAHHLEDVLDRLRMGRVALDSKAVGLLDESVTLFAAMLEKVGDETAQAEAAETITSLIARIDEWTLTPSQDSGQLDELDIDPSMLRALTEYEEHRLRENMRRKLSIFVVEVNFEILAFEEGLTEVSTAIREVGEVLSTLPSPGETPESQIRFSLLTATEQDVEGLAARLELPPSSVHTVWRPAAGGETRRSESEAPEAEEKSVSQPVADFSDTRAEIESLKSISDTVRVDIRKLDELMNLVGELVIQRAAVASIADRLSADPATVRIGSELDKVHKSLERKIQGLQTSVLEVRMVPLRQVFEKLARVVRRLRRDHDKEIRLKISGAETELDKLMVEGLVDPLMHVVRNAFDHAIEGAAERAAVGKPVEGCIRLEASQRGNDVVIAVSDDGRGIDTKALYRRAIEQGIVPSGMELSGKEMLDLVFAPGLTTRAEVTETSGRGVGMDVVRENIGGLGGIVDVDSELGQGTTITITLPITLAIIQSLIVGVADQRFAIPLNSVRETLLVDPGEIQRSEGWEMLNLRGEALPLRRLREEFSLGESPRDSKQYAVVVRVGDARLGLLVERLEGQQDAVIKAIQGPAKNVRGIAGATEFGDQGAVLVLDVSAVVEDAMRGRKAA